MVSKLLLFIDTYQVPIIDTTKNNSLYERNPITYVISEEVLHLFSFKTPINLLLKNFINDNVVVEDNINIYHN